MSQNAAVTEPAQLWPQMVFLERGWLSANQVVFLGEQSAAVVDTGYIAHAEQTLALLRSTLQGLPLTQILNTHLHSDHCGGNACLQAAWPRARTLVPPGQIEQVRAWDPHALSYTPTGQTCSRFRADAVLLPGSEIALGDRCWQIHAAPGHDPHSVLLFEPQRRILISADALWAQGFGVVFPEIEGLEAFDQVAATLDLIEALQPRLVLPGHGPAFTQLAPALLTARRRLAGFVADPRQHARYAAKVLLKFKLLEWQSRALPQVERWLAQTPYMALLHQRYFAQQSLLDWLHSLVADLVSSQAAALEERDGQTRLCNR